MTTRYEAYMGNTSLSSLDSSIVILDISHGKPEIETNAINVAYRPGAIITSRVKRSASVTITFMIRKYGIADRQEVCDEVVHWAEGSLLKTNDREGKQLHVVCEEYPVIDSAKNWTDPISMTFMAKENPYWEDATQTTLTLTGTDTSGTMNVPGSVGEAYVEAVVTANGSVDNVSLVAGSTEIELNGVSLAQNGTITIDYDANGVQRIRKGNTSILNKRTSASSDDLLAKCGSNVTFAVEADASVTVVFKVRGNWT